MGQQIFPAADLHPAQLICKILIELGQVLTDIILPVKRVVQVLDDSHGPVHAVLKHRILLLLQSQLRLSQTFIQLIVQQKQQFSLGHGINALLLILVKALHVHGPRFILSLLAHHPGDGGTLGIHLRNELFQA